jgi:hypothetical protein
MKALVKRALSPGALKKLRRLHHRARRLLLDASYSRGYHYAGAYRTAPLTDGYLAHTKRSAAPKPNPLRSYFDAVTEGPGIWKWEHYFDIYHRHLAKFRGITPTVLEVGIYSGGSLSMWLDYFGSGTRIHGVDIEETCRTYERDEVTVHIGDQEDRRFWRHLKREVPAFDVVIDDGGHLPDQQRVTLEEVLPHLAPNGVYLCEDVLGIHHPFAAFAAGLVSQLNEVKMSAEHKGLDPTPFQQAVHSIHFYPFVVVIEKYHTAPERLIAPKHGTEWQPFLG